MGWIKIRNWDKWQSYRRDRGQPPWIKIHRCLMRNADWVSLADAQKGQLVSIWLLAADKGGKVPDSPKTIQRLCYMDKPPNLQLYEKLGFIDGPCQGDVKMTPSRRQDDATETETETEYTARARQLFEIFCEHNRNLIHPRKYTASRAKKCRTRIKEGGEDYLTEFQEAVIIAQSSTFLCGGGDRGWVADFDWFIVNDSNVSSILESKYEDRKTANW